MLRSGRGTPALVGLGVVLCFSAYRTLRPNGICRKHRTVDYKSPPRPPAPELFLSGLNRWFRPSSSLFATFISVHRQKWWEERVESHVTAVRMAIGGIDWASHGCIFPDVGRWRGTSIFSSILHTLYSCNHKEDRIDEMLMVV